jgi:hypothetical protein
MPASSADLSGTVPAGNGLEDDVIQRAPSPPLATLPRAADVSQDGFDLAEEEGRIKDRVDDDLHATEGSQATGCDDTRWGKTREGPPLPPRRRDETGEQEASTVVSPPYWTHRGQGTRQDKCGREGSGCRGRDIGNSSNHSEESVLLPGAITLQDNEGTSEAFDANGVLGRDRNRACWARGVEVTDYVLVNGSTTNIGAFVVWHIRVQTLSVGGHLVSRNGGLLGGSPKARR